MLPALIDALWARTWGYSTEIRCRGPGVAPENRRESYGNLTNTLRPSVHSSECDGEVSRIVRSQPRVRVLRTVAPILLLAVAAVLVGAGCGSDDEGGGDVELGAAVWSEAGCANCHTMEAAGATGSVGPNLDELQPSSEQVADIVSSGRGGMPSFSDQLSDDEIDSVAAYVAESTGGS